MKIPLGPKFVWEFCELVGVWQVGPGCIKSRVDGGELAWFRLAIIMFILLSFGEVRGYKVGG